MRRSSLASVRRLSGHTLLQVRYQGNSVTQQFLGLPIGYLDLLVTLVEIPIARIIAIIEINYPEFCTPEL